MESLLFIENEKNETEPITWASDIVIMINDNGMPFVMEILNKDLDHEMIDRIEDEYRNCEYPVVCAQPGLYKLNISERSWQTLEGDYDSELVESNMELIQLYKGFDFKESRPMSTEEFLCNEVFKTR